MRTGSREKLNLLSDEPLIGGSKRDSLGFGKYAKVLANLARTTQGPFTFGIHAEWGYGKTSLLRRIENNLHVGEDSAKIITVWFNAWQFESDDRPLIAMILTIINAIDDKLASTESYPQKATKMLNKTKSALAAIGEGSLASLSFKSAIKVPFLHTTEVTLNGKDALDTLKEKSAVPKKEQLQQSARQELEQKSEYYRSFKLLTEACDTLAKDGFKVIVLIDDLDRCTPKNSFTLLQDIKLVLSQPGFIYFIGLDLKNLRAFIEKNYDNSGRYLDKLMQVPFYIPTHRVQQDAFIKTLLKDLEIVEQKEVLGEVLSTLSPALSYNPRATKRVVNTVLLLNEIHYTDEEYDDSGDMLLFFVFEVFLRVYYPEFYVALSACTDTNLAMISIWEEYKNRDKETTDPAEERIWDILSSEPALRELFQSDIGKVWLKEESSAKRLRAKELTAEQQINSVSDNEDYSELLSRAVISLADQQVNEGKSLLSRAIGRSPELSEAYRIRAQVYIKEKNWEAAIHDLNKVVSLDQTNVTAVRDLGRCYRKMGNNKRAIAVLTKGIAKYPKNPGILIERGTVYYQDKNPDYTLALRDFEKANELDRDNLEADLHYRWARALWLQAGGKRADKRLRGTLVSKLYKAVQIDPAHGRANDWLDALDG